MHNKMKMKGGGIVIDPRYSIYPQDAFVYFVDNSTPYFFSSGTFGVIIKLILNEGATSPYVSFNPFNIAVPVRTLIVKISVLYVDPIFNIYDYTYQSKKHKLIFASEFKKEIEIQQEIVRMSIGNLNPIAPSIVFDSLGGNIFEIIKKLSPSQEFKFYMKRAREQVPLTSVSGIIFGIIAMESIEHMQTILKSFSLERHFYPRFIRVDHDERAARRPADEYTQYVPNDHMELFLADPIKKQKIAAYIYKLIQLARFGYVHGDFHTNNILTNQEGTRAVLIDFGRCEKIKDTQHKRVEDLFQRFIQSETLNDLKFLINYIFELNNPIISTSYSPDELEEQISKMFSWFINERILEVVHPLIITLLVNNLTLIKRTSETVIDLLIFGGFINEGDKPSIEYRQSIEFLQQVITSKQYQIEKSGAESEHRGLAAASAAESEHTSEIERIRLTQEEHNNARADSLARHYILNPPSVEFLNLKKLQDIAIAFDRDQLLLFQKIKELMIFHNNLTPDIIDLIYTVKYLQVEPEQGGIGQGDQLVGGGATPPLYQSLFKIATINPTQKSSEKEVQAKIDEIKKIKERLNNTFAGWREGIYKLYTNPNIEERDAYYKGLTPFESLIHLMVCCGLFGPLESGKYIDVTDNKELSDKLNLIAAAFVTMNNGYLSMSQVKIQLMIENATKRSTVEVGKTKGPTVEIIDDVTAKDPTVEISQFNKNPEVNPELNETLRQSTIEVGGRLTKINKKYSKKRSRRKPKKKFYSKKCAKKRKYITKKRRI
jgi:hypothetical protein